MLKEIKPSDILERYDTWLNERLRDCYIEPLSEKHKIQLEERSKTLISCKVNFFRIMEELNERPL